MTVVMGPTERGAMCVCGTEIGAFACGDGTYIGYRCIAKAKDRADFRRSLHTNEHRTAKVADCPWCQK